MHLGLRVDFQKGLSINLEPEDNGIIPFLSPTAHLVICPLSIPWQTLCVSQPFCWKTLRERFLASSFVLAACRWYAAVIKSKYNPVWRPSAYGLKTVSRLIKNLQLFPSFLKRQHCFTLIGWIHKRVLRKNLSLCDCFLLSGCSDGLALNSVFSVLSFT